MPSPLKTVRKRGDPVIDLGQDHQFAPGPWLALLWHRSALGFRARADCGSVRNCQSQKRNRKEKSPGESRSGVNTSQLFRVVVPAALMPSQSL
ncbi:hypothetical protein MRX96_057243 [Rhipicephalus microplus]